MSAHKATSPHCKEGALPRRMVRHAAGAFARAALAILFGRYFRDVFARIEAVLALLRAGLAVPPGMLPSAGTAAPRAPRRAPAAAEPRVARRVTAQASASAADRRVHTASHTPATAIDAYAAAHPRHHVAWHATSALWRPVVPQRAQFPFKIAASFKKPFRASRRYCALFVALS